MMEKDKSPDQKKQASHFMAFYVVALFSIALVLILLSYLTQVRDTGHPGENGDYSGSKQ